MRVHRTTDPPRLTSSEPWGDDSYDRCWCSSSPRPACVTEAPSKPGCFAHRARGPCDGGRARRHDLGWPGTREAKLRSSRAAPGRNCTAEAKDRAHRGLTLTDRAWNGPAQDEHRDVATPPRTAASRKPARADGGLEVVRHPSAHVCDELGDEVEHELKLHVLRFTCEGKPQQFDRRVRIARSKHWDTSEARGNRAAPPGAAQDPSARSCGRTRPFGRRITSCVLSRQGVAARCPRPTRRRPTAIDIRNPYFDPAKERSAERGLPSSASILGQRPRRDGVWVIDPGSA
jgi:hypothetical protein